MGKIIKDTIHANGIDIGIYTQDFENEFISLTDIARYKSDDPTAVIQNWMRNRDVIEFLGLWERLHNPDFKPLEFEGFRKPCLHSGIFSGSFVCRMYCDRSIFWLVSGKESCRIGPY